MAIANRKFGVEIECFGASDRQIFAAFDSIDIACWREDRSQQVSDGWKLTTDGSVRDNNGSYTNCWEIVSPPLSGESGLEQITKVARALAQIGVCVNRSCGLHVHVDASDLSGANMANIAMRYAHFEQIIDSFMPQTRQNNDYARGMNDVCSNIRRLLDVQNMTARNFVNSVGCGRYYKVNLAAFLRHGTIEFRQHSGSVNGTKITNWVRFCVNFVEQSKETTSINYSISSAENSNGNILDAEGRAVYCRVSYMNYSMRQIIVALNSNVTTGDRNGLTVEQLAQIAGCRLASVPGLISRIRGAYRVGTRVLRKNRHTGKYFLRNAILTLEYRNCANNSIIQNWNYDNDTWNRGLEPEIVSYYNERRMEFA